MCTSVCLGNNWGWELNDNHLKKSFGGIDPLLENVLHEMLSLEFHLLTLHDDTELLGHGGNLFELTLHGGFTELDDWSHDELDETSLDLGTIISISVVLPLLGFGIKVVVTPKLVHHLFLTNTELGRVGLGKMSDGESPSEKS